MGLAIALLIIVGFSVYVGVAWGAEALIVCVGITAAIFGFAIVFALVVGPIVGTIDAFFLRRSYEEWNSWKRPPRDE